jgi:hypothetical protein
MRKGKRAFSRRDAEGAEKTGRQNKPHERNFFPFDGRFPLCALCASARLSGPVPHQSNRPSKKFDLVAVEVTRLIIFYRRWTGKRRWWTGKRDGLSFPHSAFGVVHSWCEDRTGARRIHVPQEHSITGNGGNRGASRDWGDIDHEIQMREKGLPITRLDIPCYSCHHALRLLSLV